jgi:hypothetical protein
MNAPDHDTGRVAVIIPTHNRATLLPRAIDSVLAQTEADCCDIVVVDDGSTDATPQAVRAYGDRIQYLRHPVSRGAAAARNTGIAASHGEFVAFLDDDDTWLPDKIARQRAAMARWPACVLVAGCAFDRYADGDLRARPRPAVPRDQLTDLAPHLLRDNFLSTPLVMVRRAALMRAGLFDPELQRAEDYHLWVRLALVGPGVVLDHPIACLSPDRPHGLSDDKPAMVTARLVAHRKLRPALRGRPDCRPAWRAGWVSRLATARDVYFRGGQFGTAARYGAALLWHAPRRPAWEWRRTAAALCRALAGMGRQRTEATP